MKLGKDFEGMIKIGIWKVWFKLGFLFEVLIKLI